jgi:hypothetical protein
MTEQTTTEQNLTEMTPVEIDTALYALYVETKQAEQRASWAWDRVKTVASKYLKKGWKDSLYVGEVREVMTLAREAAEAGQIETMVEDESLDIRVRGYRLQEVLEAAQAHEVATGAVKALEAAQQPYNDEWERRGRWTRAFIVTNANGHVHRSMHCSTCFPTTRYHWLTEMSDHDEAEIVEKAGQDACTVCYPSAPVESSTKPRQFFTPDEEAKAKARDQGVQERPGGHQRHRGQPRQPVLVRRDPPVRPGVAGQRRGLPQGAGRQGRRLRLRQGAGQRTQAGHPRGRYSPVLKSGVTLSPAAPPPSPPSGAVPFVRMPRPCMLSTLDSGIRVWRWQPTPRRHAESRSSTSTAWVTPVTWCCCTPGPVRPSPPAIPWTGATGGNRITRTGGRASVRSTT